MKQIRSYRRKPSIFKAVQLQQRGHKEVASWCRARIIYEINGRTLGVLLLQTPQGEVNAEVGDYIIEDATGHYYPCKPDDFELLYEGANTKL